MASKENLEALKLSIQNQLVDEIVSSRFLMSAESQEKKQALIKRIKELLRFREQDRRVPSLSTKEKEDLAKELVDEIMGYGPIDDLMKDDSITEIMINGPNRVYVERRGKKTLTKVNFKAVDQLNRLIQKLVSFARRKVDETTPYVDVALEDRTRVNVILPPLSLDGPAITIRKFSKNIDKIEDLVNLGTLSKAAGAFLAAAVRVRANIIFSGPTGAGKTTTLKVLARYISDDERIVVIEDTAELSLSQDNVVRLQVRLPNIEGRGEVTIRDLLKNSLRMRPDRIIIGEVRGGEALDALQAMASGHSGALGVVHAASPRDVVSRLETMVAASGINIPLWTIRKYIANNLNFIIQQERLHDGTRKITNISEIRGIANEEVVINDIFSFVQEGVDKDGIIQGEMKPTGVIPLFMGQLEKKGIKLNSKIFTKDK